ncbi:hypothetical protein [Phenylobacterium soli]|uniref:Uncharacterized protein n=1 Tax=Phenylobacterium soli TaxID=2170551 RepID=A0A328ANJ0_9CAUL|nr:hypothetical protein [Phenylobacterium soli]RAK54408.1 hypothetical protein DJ017_07670 [Phenylobacterium soli]
MTENIFAQALEEPYHDYWHQLGKFVDRFASIERSMQSILRRLAGVSDPIGAAVFSGVKVDAASSIINRICDATGQDELKARLKPALDQLGVINNVRNNILHWGASRDSNSGEFIVSNAYWAASADRLREYRVTPIDLQAMIVDLHRIGLLLAREEFTEEELLKSRIAQRVFAEVQAGAWHYKSPQQQPPKTARQPQAPKRQRQRDASQRSH